MIRQEEVYKIGKIGKPHGVKGELTLFFDDDVFDRVEAEYLVLDINGILVPFYMDSYRFKSQETALVKFCDIDTKEAAAELTGAEVFFPRELSDSDDENMTWSEIAGYEIADLNRGGVVIGTLRSIDDSTANLLMEVETPDGTDILIPAHEEFIVGVDAENKRIEVRLPEGLVELNDN